MAIVLIADRTIEYQIHPAPFKHDVLLLQSSKFNTGFWRPVLEALQRQTKDSGRVLVCEWSMAGRDTQAHAADLEALVTALGMKPLDVVAIGDATEVFDHWEKTHPASIGKNMKFTQTIPKGDDLIREISDFCGV